MIKTLDFCILHFFDNHIISIINEGEIITNEIMQKIIDVAINYYKDRPFIYISHRKHSYSVDPNIYRNISKINNFKGIAVVSEGKLAIKNAIFEKMFYNNKPFQIFNYLDDAILWVNNIICVNPKTKSVKKGL